MEERCLQMKSQMQTFSPSHWTGGVVAKGNSNNFLRAAQSLSILLEKERGCQFSRKHTSPETQARLSCSITVFNSIICPRHPQLSALQGRLGREWCLMLLQVPKDVHSLIGNSIKDELFLTQLLPLGSCHGAPSAYSRRMTRSMQWINFFFFFWIGYSQLSFQKEGLYQLHLNKCHVSGYGNHHRILFSSRMFSI